ncbi:MAG: hypothetical protein H6Q42_4687, partial [Deltaproteobacteria bacterium]|nr:hypothetical protein [Deltaproteobacteria bacterium]
MPQESILVHAGHMITAYDQPAVIGGGVVVAGNRIQEVGTADELFRRNPEI